LAIQSVSYDPNEGLMLNCPRCQTANPEGAKFCLNCGKGLEAPPRVEGERKYVTVLFADVVGSTGLAERLDPEQFAEIMNGAFAFLNASVTKYGGTVARLLGDAILAFFGAPVAHEDDARLAHLWKNCLYHRFAYSAARDSIPMSHRRPSQPIIAE
jgi:class 3 adenylate cyclase